MVSTLGDRFLLLRMPDVAAETDNPEVLESLVANATRVTLGAGQRISLALPAPAR